LFHALKEKSSLGSRREKMAGDWKRLHNEEFHNFYSSQNVSRAIKARRMKMVEHIARTENKRNAYKVLVKKLKGRDHLEDVDVDGRITLEWMLKEQSHKE
jgi:hypothetical protein